MKRSGLLLFCCIIFSTSFAQNVGIGTVAPQTKLHIKGGLLLDSTNGSTPVSGAGTRLMWIPAKAAFRAGSVGGTEWDNVNIGINSFAGGLSTRAQGNYSTALGYLSYAYGFASTAMGNSSLAFGGSSTAFGYNTNAHGDYSISMGNSTFANGIASTAMGSNSNAIGLMSTVMGNSTYASGDFSTAMGNQTAATGSSSIAMGNLTTSSGSSSTAMGSGTSASGDYSIAMGNNTMATADYSTAMGYDTKASGNFSLALGHSTVANYFSGTVIGSYNDNASGNPVNFSTTNRIFQIGNGTADNARSNAMTVLQNGNIGVNLLMPTSKLELRGPLGFSSTTKKWEINYDSVNAYFFIDEVGTARRFFIKDGGFVGINNNSPQYNLDVNGTGRFGNLITDNNLNAYNGIFTGTITVKSAKGIIRSNDGTQQKKVTKDVLINVTLAAGATTNINFTFSESFGAAPDTYIGNVVSGSGGWAEIILSLTNITSTGGILYINNPRSTSWSPNFTIRIIAIGPE